MRLCRKPLRVFLLILAASARQQQAEAQGMRDPTIAPFWSGPVEAQGDGGSSARGLRGPLSIIRVDGKFHLVVGTRLYAVGQKVGSATVERISETEVWLREGRELRKVSNFVGVKRHKNQDSAAAPRPACGASAARASGNAGSNSVEVNLSDCDDHQP